MKQLISGFMILFIGLSSFAQQKVELRRIRQYNGDSVIVCGQMSKGQYDSLATGKPTFLFIGSVSPAQQLTVTIDGESRKKFALRPEEVFYLKNVCITGKVKVVQNKAAIAVSKPEQIVVRE
ncbi:MAG TPA: hypothetical protein VF476_14745 [Chitinophagaceae bacterium]